MKIMRFLLFVVLMSAMMSCEVRTEKYEKLQKENELLEQRASMCYKYGYYQATLRCLDNGMTADNYKTFFKRDSVEFMNDLRER